MELVIKSKGENYIVLIDEEDYEKVSKYKWSVSDYCNTKYCLTSIKIDGKRTTLKLHRFLMGLEKGDKLMINHKDRNGLNNMKSNLEICDNMYNSQSINKKTRFGTIHIFKNREKKCCARVTINKKKYCKCFYTREEAEAWLDGLQEVAKCETIPFS